jgi:hypothetical protein
VISIILKQTDLEDEIALNLEKGTHISFEDCLLHSLKKCLSKQVDANDRIINNLFIDTKLTVNDKPTLTHGYSLASIEQTELLIKMSMTLKVKRNLEADASEYGISINCFGKNITGFMFDKKLKKQINYTYTDLNFQLPLMDVKSRLTSDCLTRLEHSLLPQGLYLCEYDLFGCAHEEMTYVNLSNGTRYLCSCTKEFHEELLSNTRKAISRDSSHMERLMLSELVSLPRLDDICHLCVIKGNGVKESILRYGEPSASLHYCFEAFAHRKRHESGWSWICDNVEQTLGRQKWVNENKVFLFTKELLIEQRIIREASPFWLGKQRLDVYLPDQKLAIEYQGKQHTESVEFFGGRAAYEKNSERDARKASLCKDNGVNLIYVYHHETVTLSLMKRKLKKYLKAK